MNQSMARDAVKLTASKVLTLIIGMVTAMLLSRFRTLEEYGTYSQLLMVISITTSIISLGIPNSINYFLARAESDQEKQKFLSVYYSLNTLISFATGLVLVLSAPLIASYFNNPLINSFVYFLAVFPWTQIIQASIENLLIVYQKTTGIIVFRVLNSLLLIGIIVVVQLLNWNFQAFLILFLVIQVLFSISTYLIAKSLSGKLQVDFNRELIGKILKFSVPLGLASVVGTISIELGKLVIGAMYNTEQLAIYANASREMPVTIISASLTAVLLPQLARLLSKEKNEESVTLWGKSVTLSYVFMSFFSAVLFVFAPQIISILYSDKYLPGVNVFRIFSLVILLRTTYFGILLNSKGKTKIIFYSSIASLILNLILSYLFYLLFGFIGPALASFAAIGLVNLLQLITTGKILNVPFKQIFPWTELGKISVINLLLGVSFFLLNQFFASVFIINPVILAIIIGCLWLMLYIYIMRNYLMQVFRMIKK